MTPAGSDISEHYQKL